MRPRPAPEPAAVHSDPGIQVGRQNPPRYQLPTPPPPLPPLSSRACGRPLPSQRHRRPAAAATQKGTLARARVASQRRDSTAGSATTATPAAPPLCGRGPVLGRVGSPPWRRRQQGRCRQGKRGKHRGATAPRARPTAARRGAPRRRKQARSGWCAGQRWWLAAATPRAVRGHGRGAGRGHPTRTTPPAAASARSRFGRTRRSGRRRSRRRVGAAAARGGGTRGKWWGGPASRSRRRRRLRGRGHARQATRRRWAVGAQEWGRGAGGGEGVGAGHAPRGGAASRRVQSKWGRRRGRVRPCSRRRAPRPPCCRRRQSVRHHRRRHRCRLVGVFRRPPTARALAAGKR